MLAQPPWCFHPEQIAALTDWQIENLYARPALERAKRLPGQSHRGQQSRSDQPPPPGSPEFRGWVIEQFQAMGMSLKEAEKQFEEQGRNFDSSEN